jgi:hypothetical protein
MFSETLYLREIPSPQTFQTNAVLIAAATTGADAEVHHFDEFERQVSPIVCGGVPVHHNRTGDAI